MFEFRLRILDARESDTGPNSFLGIVEGFPEILVHSTSIDQAEREIENALIEHLQRLMAHGATLWEQDDFPSISMIRLRLTRDLP